MSNRNISETTKNLMRAREYITPEANWCIARRRHLRDNGDIQVCALGALDIAMQPETKGRYRIAHYDSKEVIILHRMIPDIASKHEIQEMFPGDPALNVATYNNQSTHQQVLDWFDAAIRESIKEDQSCSSMVEPSAHN